MTSFDIVDFVANAWKWVGLAIVVGAVLLVLLRLSITVGRFVVHLLMRLRWFLDRWSQRLLAYTAACGARALVVFRRPGWGHSVNRATKWLRWILHKLVAYPRRWTFDRIVCGNDVVERSLDDPALRVIYTSRLDALGVHVALGEDVVSRSEAARHELEILRDSIDLAILFDEVDRVAQSAVNAASVAKVNDDARLDVVKDLIVPASTRAMGTFLGLDPDRAVDVYGWAELALFQVFLNPNRPAGVHDWLAESSARVARNFFEGCLNQEYNDTSTNGDTSTAVRRSQGLLHQADPARHPGASLDDERAGQMMGFALSLGPHLAWTTALAVDEMLRHPRHYRSVFSRGDPSGHEEDDDWQKRAARVVLEAIRFNPPGPGVIRTCDTEHAIPVSDDPACLAKCRQVGAGNVLVFTRSADFDPTHTPGPLRFNPDRFKPVGGEDHRAGTWSPLAFSGGRHECIGKHLAPLLMVRMLAPLMSRIDLDRAAGASGRLSHKLPKWSPMSEAGSWPFPTSLTVTFKPGTLLTD
jgi:cytochrome P450